MSKHFLRYLRNITILPNIGEHRVVQKTVKDNAIRLMMMMRFGLYF